MRVILKVHRKGIIVLPKKLREAVGINEGDEVLVEVLQGGLVLRVLRPKLVEVDPGVVEELLREEYDMERRRYVRMASHGGESGSRH